MAFALRIRANNHEYKRLIADKIVDLKKAIKSSRELGTKIHKSYDPILASLCCFFQQISILSISSKRNTAEQSPRHFFYNNLTFRLKPMGFKHTGLFPEQAVNWSRMADLIKNAGREISVLNLFGYTGAASVACVKAGAKVCHVDGAKAMVERAGDNLRLSGLEDGMRYIIDDCFKFCEREKKRGRKYDAIILDPPSFGRGPNGEKWKIEEGISELCELVSDLLSDNPLFVCLNSYTTGLQPTVMANILKLTLPATAKIEADEIGIPTDEGLVLPQGCTAFATF